MGNQLMFIDLRAHMHKKSSQTPPDSAVFAALGARTPSPTNGHL